MLISICCQQIVYLQGVQSARQEIEQFVSLPDNLCYLYNTAVKFTRGNVDQANDLRQSAVERALKYHSKLKPGTNIKAWIGRILYRCYCHNLRQAYHNPVDFDFNFGDNAGNSDFSNWLDNAKSVMAGQEDLILLQEIFQLFAADSIETKLLYDKFCNDLDDQELSDKYQLTLGTVKSRLSRLRRKLEYFAGVSQYVIPKPATVVLRKRLQYFPDSGQLLWRACDSMSPAWNARWANKPAGYFADSVYVIRLSKHKYRAADIIWAWMNNSWPDRPVTYANGDTTDQRWCNLTAN